MMNIVDDVKDDFADYFRARGLEVTWDHSRDRRQQWYEILIPKGGKQLMVQVDMGTPLAAFLEDLPCFAQSKHGTSSAPRYQVNGSPENFRALLEVLGS
jgi:hypothetical protein